MKQVERDELLTRLDERTQNIEKNIKMIKNTLFGNGKEGLCYIVQRHKVFFALISAALVILGTAIVSNIFGKI